MSKPKSVVAINGDTANESIDFIRRIINDDNKSNKHQGRIATRFPPEPNGYLHIGHAKSICLNFGIAKEYKGTCNLRFDDTNPATEEVEYIDNIINDVHWLGFSETALYYTSDYYQQLYDYAELLVQKGKAFVCDLSAQETRAYRGTLKEPGRDSPYRNRTIAENLDLFRRMRSGEFADGSRTLRAKIDMNSPNLNMRDPVMYRVKRQPHPRTGDTWCIYPMYDYAHPLSDAIEGITHSICTLEFEAHRPLYDWFIVDFISSSKPQQIEFARLNLSYTIMSKRKLKQLVDEKHVSGWNDPRMPTLAGLRRRGYTPSSIHRFAELIGVAKADSIVDFGMLEYALRQDLENNARRVMCVLKPLKIVITNWDTGKCEIEAPYFPEDPDKLGTRQLPIEREIFIDADDFLEDPPKKFFRLAPLREVRLRYGYIIKCEQVIKDASGNIVELHCTYDPATRGGKTPDGRKVKGTIHWVAASQALPVEVRLYDRLFTVDNPGEGGSNFLSQLNPQSLEIVKSALAEPSLASAQLGENYQFERCGYFCLDSDSKPDALIFNRTVTLKDSWAKIIKKSDQE
ncbi:MAG: glutamine--tRNA ligase/YqeY domain fusion protein [Deltaproteobacteria bacterium]|nr:glutamine--tRNA ligase/YqeY domain fusion protein [Deltaproteobacteria bacterium]